jgi:hypothetical protein
MSLEIGSQAVHQRRGAADCGQYREAPGATEKGVKTLESSFRAAFVLAVP